MKRFVIERDVPGVGGHSPVGFQGIAQTSNAALARLSPRIQWEQSYVVGDKTFCIYLADDEAVIQRHAELSGFPATRITPVVEVIDPTTANG